MAIFKRGGQCLPILPPTYDEVVVAGEYTDKDGQEVLVDSDLFHPSVRAALSRTDEDFFPDSKNFFIHSLFMYYYTMVKY